MKNKILSVMLVMTLLISICGVAVAADAKGGSTRSYLKSYGSIEYHNGDDKVVINADDLYMLADQIDQVKLDVADQLEAMNTYFTAGNGISLSTDDDISITHSQPSRSDTVDPLSVNFDTMLEGIAASQSISTDVKDYGYAAGTKLYQSADGSLTTNGSEDGTRQVTITAATPENLSAGTVAWVNGELILGTGGDNKSYFDLGSGNDTDVPGSSGIDKAKLINLRGSNNDQETYLVQEDMEDVFIYISYLGSNVIEPTFDTLSSSAVSCTRIFSEKMPSYGSLTPIFYVYYVPKLEKGTTITNFVGPNKSYTKATYLFKADGSGKGQNVKYEKLTGVSAYSVKTDLQDVFYINLNNGNFPTFETLPGDSIVAYKRLFYSSSYTGSVFYIPELKAGTVIKNISSNAHIVY